MPSKVYNRRASAFHGVGGSFWSQGEGLRHEDGEHRPSNPRIIRRKQGKVQRDPEEEEPWLLGRRR